MGCGGTGPHEVSLMLGIAYQIPTFLQRLYGGVVWRASLPRPLSPRGERGDVYLTFDDGPRPEITPQLLDILKEEGVRATFFMVGENAARYPELVERVRREGHTIGNHTYHHVKGWKVSVEEYIEEVMRAQKVLTPPRLSSGEENGCKPFRPPYGKMTWRQKRALRQMGYDIYLWDVLTHDYDKDYSSERMLEIIRQYTRPGSIINFHDSVKSADRTPETVKKAIQWLKQEGYSLLPLPC